MVETDFYAILDAADRGAVRSICGGGGVSASLHGAPGLTLDVITPGNPQTLLACCPYSRLTTRSTGSSAVCAQRSTKSGLSGTPELGDSIRPGGFGGTVDRNPGYPELLPHPRGDGHWRGGPCPRARSRNTDCQQGSNWAAKQTAPCGRSSGGRSPRRKTRGGRLDSTSLSSLFDRGARAKRVVPEIDGEGAGHLNGCNFSNLKAPTFHRRPKPKAGRYAWDSGGVK